ncbi:hypothetical protein HanRHA438_Chr16g0787961 [Helianthus annuus]|nr:hypothetical protein HanRHA438_Chr16g0787961 [Helianthus annuus]
MSKLYDVLSIGVCVKEESSSQAKQQGNQDRGTLLVQFMILLYCCV